MSWVTPKTDWQVREYVNGLYNGDWFNLSDYDRIRGNLEYLRILAQNVLHVVIPQTAMPPRGFGAYPRASDFNTVEANLFAVVNVLNLLPPGYYSKTDWAANGPFLTFEDLNRIESATAWLKEYVDERRQVGAFIPSGENGLIDANEEAFMVIEEG